MRLTQAIFLLLQKAIYFFHESMKFFGILFNGGSRTEFHPAFFLLALHCCGPPVFREVEVRIEILKRNGLFFQDYCECRSAHLYSVGTARVACVRVQIEVRQRTDTPAGICYIWYRDLAEEVRFMSQIARTVSGGAGPNREWHQLYEAAMLELDNDKMSKRIFDARHAIIDRAEEIITGSPSDERGALNDALQALRILEQVAAKEKRAA
jgi:hypothetical protein